VRSRRAVSPVVLALTSALVLAGCGDDDQGAASTAADRVVTVTMTDNAFDPAGLTVAAGETVTFRFENRGAAVHEAVIGDGAYQSAHSDAMDTIDATPGTEHDLSGASAGSEVVVVQPGDSWDLTYTFIEAGTLLIGCHQPGHYESGMSAAITVT
jgi:uncharacterized cupredoxin-like copper-binding protein